MANTLSQRNIVPHIVLSLGAVIMVGPFVWELLTSFKTFAESIQVPPIILPASPQWSNYQEVFDTLPFAAMFSNTVIMTIAQAGTGSGASGEAVRNIYSALYGVQPDGSIDTKKALLPTPQKSLPKVKTDGTITSPQVAGDPVKDLKKADKEGATAPDGTQPGATTTASPTATNRNTRRRPRRRGNRRMLT